MSISSHLHQNRISRRISARQEETGKMDPSNLIDRKEIPSGVPTNDRQGPPSASAPPTSAALQGSSSKSPLKIPQGVIVRTPSGKDGHGRRTPPRFFTITNQQLQQMHSTVSTEAMGPKHFQFEDANQTLDGGRVCSCTSPPQKTETVSRQNPKDTRGCSERIKGMVTLKSLLEGEICRSNVMQTQQAQKGDTQTEREKTAHPHPSPFASPTGKLSYEVGPSTQNHKGISTTASCLSDERRGSPHDKYNVTAKTKLTHTPGNKPNTARPSTSELSSRNIIPKPPTETDQPNSKCKSGGASLESAFEQHLPTPDGKVPKGSLLDILLSTTEPFDNDRLGIRSLSRDFADRRTTAGIHDAEVVPEVAGIVIPSNPKEPTQNITPVSEVQTDVPTLKNRAVGVSAVSCKKAESNITLDDSIPPNRTQLHIKTSGTPKASVVPVSSEQGIDKPLLTLSEKTDVSHSSKASSTKVNITEVHPTPHVETVSGTLRGKLEMKKKDDKVINFENFQKTPKPSHGMRMSENNTPGKEQKTECAPKTTLIINPVIPTSATANSPGPSGQLYGLVRSSNNPTGPMVLVALASGPQSSNGNTTLTASGNHLNSVKAQSCTPVVINNVASTGNLNTDAFNVWKSYVRKPYQDKYGTNCDYYMHNQWVSMSVAEKSPFVHQARNRRHPPVVVQTSTSIPHAPTKEVIVGKAPTAKNSKPAIQRQMNVIPRLQTTANDEPTADNPVSINQQDVLGELYRSTNMADLSPDFPMATNNSTFRKMMKGSVSNFLADPAASLDPLFAQCLLSGRRYDIDNWIAMKTNWRVTPDWIVDFLADYDKRKKARKAAIDAGVMRRVAMVQRMATMQHDDDDDAGSSTSTVQTPQKHSGKRYQQDSDSKENTTNCQGIKPQSGSTVGSSSTVQHGNTDDKSLTPAKAPTATRTPPREFGLVRTDSIDQMTSGSGEQSPHNEYQRSTIDLKTQFIPPKTPTHSCSRGPHMVSRPTGQGEGLQVELSTVNADNNSVKQEESGYSREGNIFGDLDLIDDEELWNIQCRLFPPCRRVPSFIDADAVDDFFKDLVKDSVCDSDTPAPHTISYAGQMEKVGKETSNNGSQSDLPADEVYHTERDTHCSEIPIMSSLIEEIIPPPEERSTIDPSAITHIGQSENIIGNLPNVKRSLFSDTSFKNACQPTENISTENMTSSLTDISKATDIHTVLKSRKCSEKPIDSTNTDSAANIGIQPTYPLNREAEEDAAACKLLEILNESQQPTLSKNVEPEEKIMYQDNTSGKDPTTEEHILKDVAGGIAHRHEDIHVIAMGAESSSSLDIRDVKPLPAKQPWNEMAGMSSNNCGSHEKNDQSNQLEIQRDTANEINHDLFADRGSPDRGSEIEKWHKEIQPIIALAVNSSSSSSSVENELRRTYSEEDQRRTPTLELQVNNECDKPTEALYDNSEAGIEEDPKVIPTAASSSGEYVTADETELSSTMFDGVKTPDHCPISAPETPPHTSVSDTFNSENLQNSITPDVSNPRVSADSPTSENGESDILDEETDQPIFSEEKKTRVSAPRYHGRMRKRRRQDDFRGDPKESNLENSVPVAQSSSEASMTSVASVSPSPSLISKRRKRRGKKRRQATKRHRNKPERKSTDGCSPSESHPSVGAPALHPDADKNDNEGDAPSKSPKTRSTRQSMRSKTAKSSKDNENVGDGSSKPHDIRRNDHEGDDGSSDESQDEFVIADKSPTSLKIVMRKSSRLRIRRVLSFPRLRSKRHGSVFFQMKESKTSVHDKVSKTGKRKRGIK